MEALREFNVRVYALFINDQNQVLVSDEIIRGKYFTKFPGGGLELGESPVECLHRECQEEMNQPIEVLNHFHTTDQFVRSAFRPWEQVISIYHRCKIKGDNKFKTSTKRFDFDRAITGDQEAFRWADISTLDAKEFEFLIDAHVVGLIKKQFS
ncbi:NUDIX domain-containing protein [bacterium SCSIO 12741]|nr:NUDIX domain-containing protein [bacterium SCSIO 12741]